MSTKWIVTGAAGFLGSHVIEQLVEKGDEVVAIDNMEWGVQKHIDPFMDKPNFKFYKQDICEIEAIQKIFNEEKATGLIHLAAIHFIPDCIKDPSKAVKFNIFGSQVVLKAALDSGVKNLWFASTGDVYKPSEEPHKEEHTVEPFNIYGKSKLLMEELVRFAANEHPDRRIVIGRLLNLYGARETNPHILPEIIGQLKKDINTTLRLGNLYPKRDLVPIHEVAKTIYEIFDKVEDGCYTLNFATGVAQSMQEVIDMIGEVLGKKINVETDPAKVRKSERPHLQADVSKLKDILGWTPNHDLKSGLTELLKGEGLL